MCLMTRLALALNTNSIWGGCMFNLQKLKYRQSHAIITGEMQNWDCDVTVRLEAVNVDWF